LGDSIGIVTNDTLMMFRASFGESRTVLLKRAALLHDRILLPMPRGLAGIDRRTYLRLTGSQSVQDIDPATSTRKYQNLFLDVSDVLKSPGTFDERLWSFETEDLWRSGGKAYHDHVSRLVKRREIQHFGGHDEAMKFYLPALSMDVRAYGMLLDALPNAVALSTPHHASVLRRFGGKPTKPSGSPVKSLLDVAAPDFGSLSWSQILELRSDPYLKDFRRKVAGLAANGPALDKKALRNVVDSSLWNFVAENEPRVTRTILSAVVGNLPVPSPVNPVGLATSALEVVSEIRKKRSFGWLVFITRLRRRLHDQS
jgi:hypothetical protein